MNFVIVLFSLIILMLQNSGDILLGGCKSHDEALREASNVVVGSNHGAWEGHIR